MAQTQDNFKRGTAEFLILSLLNEGEPMHGYRITQEMASRSGWGEPRFVPGLSLYYDVISLMRMEEEGLIEGRVALVGKKRKRKYYCITQKGKEQLDCLLREFDEVMYGIELILRRKEAHADAPGSPAIS